MIKNLTLWIFVFAIHQSFCQVYTEKKTQHRFAQLNFGLGYQASFGGSTDFINPDGNRSTLELRSLSRPRLLIGGTHFWGHADFYLAIPLFNPSFKSQNQKALYLNGVETVFKYYPLRIEHHKIRPFLGLSFAPFYYEQDNENFDFEDGPQLNHTAFPILAGFTFNTNKSLFEIGFQWNYTNKQEYYISREEISNITTPPIYANISYRYMLDTTLKAEDSWESGETLKNTEHLAEQNKLNSFYIGLGLSSAFWLGKGTLNTAERPFVEKYSTSIMPDLTLGYYWHRPDINLSAYYKSYGSSLKTYGVNQAVRRTSIGLEFTKYVIDTQGFSAFIGPTVSIENLSFKESFERQLTYDTSDRKTGYGLTFGWDIRPNRLQKWILRTNLRWYPNLKLDVEDSKNISFNALEFNFIQFIVFPERLGKKMKL